MQQPGGPTRRGQGGALLTPPVAVRGLSTRFFLVLLFVALVGFTMCDVVSFFAVTTIRLNSSSVKMISKANKADLIRRFQQLVDESQQDLIVNVFTPVARSRTLNSVTCATQGGLSKLPRLIDMTSRWLGPVSFSTVVTSEHDLDVLFQFWTDNPLIQEYVSLHLLMELPQLKRSENGHYPINQLRNLALQNVKTDYVFLNDVDFVPSDHAHDEIAALIQDSHLATKTFWVLPAFERLADTNTTDPTHSNDQVNDVNMIPKSKPAVGTLVARIVNEVASNSEACSIFLFFLRTHKADKATICCFLALWDFGLVNDGDGVGAFYASAYPLHESSEFIGRGKIPSVF
jgi:Glycosyl-transferase for dystroglycan